MAKTTDLSPLPLEARRDFFRKAYMIELGRLHATGACRWPVEQLPAMVDKAMAAVARKEMPIGSAMDATRKMFGLKTQKATFELLGY